MAIDPFTQQVIHLKNLRTTVESQAVVQIQRFFAHSNNSLAIPQSAVYGALYGGEAPVTNVICQSGDCDWAPYQSLAICHQYADVTEFVQVDDWCFRQGNLTCDIHLANLLSINLRYPQGDYYPHGDILKMTGHGPLLTTEGVGISLANITRLYISSDPDAWNHILDCSYAVDAGTCEPRCRDKIRSLIKRPPI